jgi:hypothetical protein
MGSTSQGHVASKSAGCHKNSVAPGAIEIFSVSLCPGFWHVLKLPNWGRQVIREPGGPEPLSVGPAAYTRLEVRVRWACHLTYT